MFGNKKINICNKNLLNSAGINGPFAWYKFPLYKFLRIAEFFFHKLAMTECFSCYNYTPANKKKRQLKRSILWKEKTFFKTILHFKYWFKWKTWAMNKFAILNIAKQCVNSKCSVFTRQCFANLRTLLAHHAFLIHCLYTSSGLSRSLQNFALLKIQ